MPHKPEEETGVTPTQAVNGTYGLCRVHGATSGPFIRCSQGTHAYSVIGPLAFLMMAVYGAATESAAMLFGYIPAWLLMVIVRRVRADYRESSGYPGFSYITARVPFFHTEKRARSLEPILLAAIGTLIYQFSQPLGVFIGMGCISSAFLTVADHSALAVRARHVRDQENQMRALGRELGR
jgi:hypothetical protein